MFKDLNGRKFITFLRFGVAALTIVAATEAFARGEGSGGEGGGGVEVSTHPGLPQLDTPPGPVINVTRSTPIAIPTNNCNLQMRQLRYC